MEAETPNIYDLSLADLRAVMEEWGERPFHSEQVFRWLYAKRVKSFDAMSDLSLDLRRRLGEEFILALPEEVETSRGTDTQKRLLRLSDGAHVECVRIESDKGMTACLSSQAGCRLGCAFCATARVRPVRNLTPGEITGQLLHLLAGDEPVGNIVFMGMGEPFHNYENLMKAIDILQTSRGMKVGARRMTISTAGSVPEIYRFANEESQVNLAVSLNAPNDKIRRKLMPIARYYPMERLFSACEYYVERTNRRLSFEYVLIQGVNDARSHAKELAALVRGNLYHVNLIAYNPVDPDRFRPPGKKRIKEFSRWLNDEGAAATVRRSPGRDIKAACGQLAGGKPPADSRDRGDADRS
jgi:23S rRNA (adenine2503-C2)-methyltransferase